MSTEMTNDERYMAIGKAFVEALNLTSRGTIDEIKSRLDQNVWGGLIELVEGTTNLTPIKLSADLLEGDGLLLVDAFCISRLTHSKAGAQVSILQGGAYINGCHVLNVQGSLYIHDLNDRDQILLGIRHKKAILEFED